MFKSRSTVSTLTLTTLLVLSAGGASIVYKDALAATLNPASKWTSTMVEGATQGTGYCALTRKFDEDVIVTIGQSAMSEFSLALDFRNQKLDMNKAYKIELEPAPGETRKFDMMPTSENAIVARLGYDDSFIRAVKKSNAIKTKIDGKEYNFAVTDMSAGQDELNKCMAGLLGEQPVQTASNVVASKAKSIASKTTSAVKKTAKKVIDIPAAVVEKSTVSSAPLNIEDMEPAVEVAKKPIKISRTDSQALTPIKVPTKKIINIEDDMPAVSAPKVEEIKQAKAPEIKVEKIETKVSKPAQKNIKAEEIKIVQKDTKKPAKTDLTIPPPMRDEPKVKKTIIANADSPQKAVRISRAPDIAESKPPVRIAVADRKLTPTEFDEEIKSKTKSAIKIINKEDEKALTKPQVKKPEPKIIEPKKEEVKIAKVEKLESIAEPKAIVKKEVPQPVIETGNLILSNTELNAPKPFSSTKSEAKDVETKKPRPPVVVEKAKVAKEIKLIPEPEIKVSQAVTPRTLAPIASPSIADVKADAKTEKELQEIRQQLSELERENRTLFMEAKKARGQIDSAVVDTSNEALKQMRVYEQKLSAARADNMEMAKEVEEMRRLQEDLELNAAASDPNLQRSMQRYNEAQREIKRLGLLLEQQKLSHRQEKTELEEMLFDPAVTDDVQRKKLAELEQKLQQAQTRLDEESKRVNVVNTQSKQKLEEMERKFAAAKIKERQLQAEELKLKTEAQKIAAAESKLTALATKETLLKDKEARLLAEQQKMQARLQNVTAAETKLEQTRLKEQEMRAREAKLKLEEQKIEAAETRLAEVRLKEQRIADQQKALAEKSRILAQAEAKMAQAKLKEQELLTKQRALQAQEQKLQQMTRERLVAAPLASPSQNTLAGPARNRFSSATPSPVAQRQIGATSSSSLSQSSLQSMLNNSGIAGVSALAQQSPNLYVWRANGMNGRAEIAAPAAVQNLNQYAQSYIARERNRCSGDFASLPSSVSGGKTGYELACVNSNGTGKASSIVFVQKGRDLISVSHETSAANMNAAIDARDKIANFL